MSGLKQPRKTVGYLSDLSEFEPFKAKWRDAYYTGMMVKAPHARFVLMIDKAGAMKAYPPGDLPTCEFLGYLTTEETITIAGSLPVDWVEPEISPIVAERQIPLPEGANASDVPDFAPYILVAGSGRYETLNVPCQNGKRIGLCYRFGGSSYAEYASLISGQRFERYIECTDLTRWQHHNSIKAYNVIPYEEWP